MITIISCVAQNRVIGNKGQIPWRLPSDLKRFRQLTLGHPVVMGRKTWTSLGRPLQGRTNVVLSRDPDFKPEGALVASTLAFAIGYLANKNTDEIFIIGGQAVYEEALPLADRILLTDVNCEPDGDCFFPVLGPTEYILTSESDWQQETGDQFRFRFLEFVPSPKLAQIFP